MHSFLKLILLAVLVVSMSKCKSDDSSKTTLASIPKSTEQKSEPEKSNSVLPAEEQVKTSDRNTSKTQTIDAEDWTEITSADGFVIDMKYAGNDNFTKRKIYDCGKCFLRPEAARRLKDIHAFLNQKYGYRIKVFDCFRPRPYQQRLWDIVPDPNYVTPPNKGSMH
ncbi:MAG: M15 family metallopeptidase, partial [Saprospiraceae bacterium]